MELKIDQNDGIEIWFEQDEKKMRGKGLFHS
jgi:hypothetical protein